MTEVLQKQVAGDHYKKHEFQPIELFAQLNLNSFQGNITKYITRYRDKNGRIDLEKVIHYAELGRELSPTNFTRILPAEGVESTLNRYVYVNRMHPVQTLVMFYMAEQRWDDIIKVTTTLITEEYGELS